MSGKFALYCRLPHSNTNPLTFLRLRVEDQYVRNIERHFLVDDAALNAGVRIRLLVFLGDVDALNQHAFIFKYLQDGAATALVLAGRYNHFIAFSDLVHCYRFRIACTASSYRTSGANEIIFIN